jgi:hypothetical protein
VSASLRPTLGGVQWAAAALVALHAAIREVDPEASLPAVAGVHLAAGLLLWWPGSGAGLLAALVRETLPRAALLAAGGVLFGLAWGALTDAIDAPAFTALGAWALVALLLLLDGAAWRRIGRLMGVEGLKLRRSRLFLVSLLVVAASVVVTALAHERLPRETGWSMAMVATGPGFWIAEVFVLVFGATSIAGEATQGTLKMIVPHAYRRSDWIGAKTLVVLLFALLLALLVTGLGLGYAAATDGLGPLVRVNSPEDQLLGLPPSELLQPADVMWDHAIDASVGGLGSLAATAALGVLCSCLFLGVVPALCVAFLALAALKFGNLVLGFSQETLERLYPWGSTEMRSTLTSIGRALSDRRWDDGLLERGLLLALLSGALCLVFSVRLFSRRDLHV